MVRQGFDLEMKRCHVGEEAGLHQFFQVCPRLGAMSGRAVEKTSDGPYGLQEGRNTEVVECCRKICHAEVYHRTDISIPIAVTRSDAPYWHLLPFEAAQDGRSTPKADQGAMTKLTRSGLSAGAQHPCYKLARHDDKRTATASVLTRLGGDGSLSSQTVSVLIFDVGPQRPSGFIRL